MRARFYCQETDSYKFYKIKIAPSTIEGAEMGIFAMQDIPKGLFGVYRGVKKTDYNDVNPYYSWEINPYDDKGEPVKGKSLFWIDAFDKSKSNWTRYVNCGLNRKLNNLTPIQEYEKMYYYTSKKIKAGDELFIDYGLGYRRNNLGLKGKY
jgi:hypothetical protein